VERLRAAFRQTEDLATPRARAREAMVRGAMAVVRFNGSGGVGGSSGRRGVEGEAALSLRSFFRAPAKWFGNVSRQLGLALQPQAPLHPGASESTEIAQS
jgi:hypothetical protein